MRKVALDLSYVELNRTNGIQCLVPCENQVLQNPPKLGSVITVKHFGYYGNGTLKHPFFWREREDIDWKDITSDSKEIKVRKEI